MYLVLLRDAGIEIIAGLTSGRQKLHQNKSTIFNSSPGGQADDWRKTNATHLFNKAWNGIPGNWKLINLISMMQTV